VAEEFPFGPEARVFKVHGKMFAIFPSGAAPQHVTLKCDPGIAERLRRDYEAITPGYHTNKRHWNTVQLDGSIPTGVVRRMLASSYGLVLGARSTTGVTSTPRSTVRSRRSVPGSSRLR
jgi:predicted DNA-binding protein (MmcQ/YjbR family)